MPDPKLDLGIEYTGGIRKPTPEETHFQAWVDSTGLNLRYLRVSGTTLQRPVDPPPGFTYFDTDEQDVLYWDGEAWASVPTAPVPPSQLVVGQETLDLDAIEPGQFVRRSGSFLVGKHLGRQVEVISDPTNLAAVDNGNNTFELPISDNLSFVSTGLSGAAAFTAGTKQEGSTTFVLVEAGTFDSVTLDPSLDGSGSVADSFDSGEDCLFIFQFVAGRTLAAMQIVTGTGI